MISNSTSKPSRQARPDRRPLDKWITQMTRAEELSPTERAICHALSRFANWDSELAGAHPGNDKLREVTGYSRSTIRRALQSLQCKGWIRPAGGHGYGRGRARTWQLIRPDPCASQDVQESPS